MPKTSTPICAQPASRHFSALFHPAKIVPDAVVYSVTALSPRTSQFAATLLAATLLAINLTIPQPTQAQAVKLQDPANLTGERVSPQDPADTLAINHGAPALQQLLLKLRTRASFMLIVAHPDDEDGGLLTYLSRGQGARVAMLTLNRGEGGQNLMSADFDDALGLIRTQELLAADRYMGVDQFFGTEVDFGFSKSKEEAFSKWTHDRVLYDAVRAVRLYRPLVIASVFIGGPTDGHGQHQVAGEIAQEVFTAAGDPKVFPDQIAAGLQPWQPLKVYARVPFARIVSDATGTQTIYDSATNQYTPARFTNYVTGEVTTAIPSTDVIVREGQLDPLLTNGAANIPYPDGVDINAFARKPMSYVQFARLGLALQKSQIGPNARPAPAGPMDIAYHRYGSRLVNQPTHENGFFDGIDTSLLGIASLSSAPPAFIRSTLSSIATELAATSNIVEEAHSKQPDLLALDEQSAAQVGPKLAGALKSLDQLIARIEAISFPAREDVLHELRIKRVQLNDALVATFDLYISSDNSGIIQVAAQPLHLAQPPHLVQALPAKLVFNYGWSINSAGQGMIVKAADVPGASSFAFGHPLDFPCNLTLQQIVTTRPYFFRDDIEQSVYKLREPSLRNAPGTPPALTCGAELAYQGTTIQLSTVSVYSFVPPVNVGLRRQKTLVLPEGNRSFNVPVNLEAQSGKLNSLTFDMPPGWQATPAKSFGNYVGEYRIDLPSDLTSPVTIQAKATLARREGKASGAYTEGYLPAGYLGLTSTNYYTPAFLHVIPVNVTTAPNLNVAYLPGTGDDIPAALNQLGVRPHFITISDLTPCALKPYDAVIFGVRAYEAHPELAAANAALNTYAANGGIVIAQYNTGRLPENTGPYPLSLGDSEKVVEEDAPVQILAPTDPLLTWPNRITQADFDHWIEERGHGFMATWDPHYQALLETHDHGQQSQRGGLLIAHTGRGAWIYLGLALYRQLPEGVPGAYRILANLISAAKNPALQK